MATRILVVEDEPHIAELLQVFLVLEGYEVDVAIDGAEALARLADEPPALVVLDGMLPRADGWRVLAGVRSTPGWRAVPVVMLTARTEASQVARALAAGADDYLTKPFQLDELQAAITRLVRVSAGARG